MNNMGFELPRSTEFKLFKGQLYFRSADTEADCGNKRVFYCEGHRKTEATEISPMLFEGQLYLHHYVVCCPKMMCD